MSDLVMNLTIRNERAIAKEVSQTDMTVNELNERYYEVGEVNPISGDAITKL